MTAEATSGATSDAEDTAEGTAEDTVERRVLRDENAQLQEAVHAHAVVDQAIGVVIVLGRLTPVQGWELLREVSQRTNIKLRRVAELVVEWARTEQLSPDIRTELMQQLERVRIAQTPPGPQPPPPPRSSPSPQPPSAPHSPPDSPDSRDSWTDR